MSISVVHLAERSCLQWDPYSLRRVPELAVLDHATVLAAVSAQDAIEATRGAFLRHHTGEWTMPAKVYVQSPPYGDFRAMPALGGGFALLKWITSFPGNLAKGMPTVNGVVCLSDARTGLPLALLDAPAVTALRTGAVAAVASAALAQPGASSVGIIGCGLNGAWVARCMAAAGYGPGVCSDPRAGAAQALAAELRWSTGDRAAALACDIVCGVTPGAEIVVEAADLRPGQHLNMLGADGSGKAEASIDAVVACELFCDEWAQASHGGELTGAVEAGRVTREQVTVLGAVLAGEDGAGRSDPEAITLFDSTGLAIQDLAVSIAALQAARDGRVAAGTLTL
jgi:alanine dehydrogenase